MERKADDHPAFKKYKGIMEALLALRMITEKKQQKTAK